MRIIVDGLAYPIIVSDAAPSEAADIGARQCARAVVVSDRNVESRGSALAEELRRRGCDVLARTSIEAGERRKQWRAVSELHGVFLTAGLDRAGVVFAVGGGTLTDVAGFAAATFLRGVRWIAVPTTVLGMVDAAIGGKTGVDRPEGKNLIGAVWQPTAVVADIAALETLPVTQRRTGMAEVVKAAIVGDPSLFDAIEHHDIEAGPEGWARIVAQAAAVKVRVVAKDPDDSGVRAILNLGHTFAHAIEHASSYRVAHGAAVALGLRAAGAVAHSRTGWSLDDHHRVLRALRRSGLRVRWPKLPADRIIEAMQMDKKRRNGTVRFVLPVRAGEVRPGVEVPESAVREALALLEARPLRDAW